MELVTEVVQVQIVIDWIDTRQASPFVPLWLRIRIVRQIENCDLATVGSAFTLHYAHANLKWFIW